MMITDQLSLFPELFPEEKIAASASKTKDLMQQEMPQRKQRKKTTDDQLELFNMHDVEAVMERKARKKYIEWLKHSLREYPRLNDKIARLEQLAAGIAEEKALLLAVSAANTPHRTSLSYEERQLAEIIKAVTPEAFHKKPTGLLTSGRFYQQVRTLFQKQTDLQPIIAQLIDYSGECQRTNSPVELNVLRRENSRGHAAEKAKQLRKKKAVFDEALGQLKKYQPDSYELLRLRFMKRYTVVKVQYELGIDSESTFAAYQREALHWLSLYVKDAQARTG